MQLIVMLYEGGISAVQEAIRCLESREIMARAKAITKAHNILAELQISLRTDTAETKAVSDKLSQLYAYMQKRLLEAHLKQTREPLAEVEGLLRTMLEGWYVVAQQEQGASQTNAAVTNLTEPAVTAGEGDVLRISYGGYYREPAESYSALAFSF
jgi:flagellar protein FliS